MNTSVLGSMQPAYEYEERELSLADYWAIAKRRFWHILLPAVVVFVLGVMVALALPAVYRSNATILIEEQEIPRDMVRSTVTSFAAQQIQVITQRVMTVENIEQVVEKFGLYGQDDADSRLPRTELAKLFRENVTLDVVSADVIDPRSGRPTEATIAFTLAFDDPNPSTAQKVTNELVTLYLNTNISARKDRAAGASDFLTAQAEALNSELIGLEARLAEFKELNKGALPELQQFNLSIVERTEREIADINLRLQQLEKDRIRLAAELTQLSPSAPTVLSTGETVLSDVDRLRAMESEYRAKAALYKDSHPDIKRLKREIAVLRATLGVDTDAADTEEQIRQQRDMLAQLKGRYTEDHPKVVAAAQVLHDLQAQAESGRAPAATLLPAAVADNPAYVLLDTQLKATQAEAASLRLRRGELKHKLAEYDAYLQRAPAVEKEYQSILREYNTAQAKYQDLRLKQREAEVSRNLEQERKGERFTLIEPPNIPLEPESPNRLAIVLVSLVLAGAAGLASGFVFEASDKGVYNASDLQRLVDAPMLVTIPYLTNGEDEARAKRRVRAMVISGLLLILTFLVAAHFLFKPLDVIWFVLLNRIGG